MAIAFDTSSTGVDGVGTTMTWSHTCTGDDRIFFVCAKGNATDTITGVTYATVAMTRIAQLTTSGSADLSLWYLINPASGANDAVITSSTSTTLRGKASSFTGAKQSGVPDASGTQLVTAAAGVSKAITTVADNCWLVAASANVSGVNTAGANTTVRRDGDSAIMDSNAAQTPAGSYSQAVTFDGNADGGMIVASFAPLAAAAANHWLLMGV